MRYQWAIVWLFLSAAALPIRAEERKPNILLILADDLGYGDVGFNGRREWKTPHLDRLARQGMRFTRWYTAAVVCAPSRATLLTGKYTIHNGVSRNDADLPTEEVTLAEALKEQGYATALFGKWHHGRPRGGAKSYVHPMDQGFDEFFGFTNAGHAWEHFPKNLWHGRERKPVSGYSETLFAERTIEFIRSRSRPNRPSTSTSTSTSTKTGPWFVYLSLNAPHFHVEAPPEDVERHRGKFPEKSPSEPVNAAYAAMIERQDFEVGRVLKALDEAGAARNTVVIYTSDHGATFEVGTKGAPAFHDSNRPFRGQKRTLWEGGIRVPGVVRWPARVPAGRACGTPFHNIDLLPTLLDAAGVSPDPAWKLDGKSALDVWMGRSAGGPRVAPQATGGTPQATGGTPQATGGTPQATGGTPALQAGRTYFWEWRSEGYNQLAAMRGDLKLVITNNGPPELFDVVRDPGERINRAAEMPGVAKELRDALTAWLATEEKGKTEYR